MNPGVTSKEAILQVCRRMAAEQGLSAINMRAVARECGIAPGTLYHYYTDKDALLLATVESVWKDIFHGRGHCETAVAFPDYVAELFACAKQGTADYPHFLTSHSVALAKIREKDAKALMGQQFCHMKAGMLAVLNADDQVNPAVFTPSFSAADFVEVVLDNLLLLLLKDAASCRTLTELISRVLYR